MVVFTTETSHHTYFVQELSKVVPLEYVLVEKNAPVAPFETLHPFEKVRESYERNIFWGGSNISLSDVAKIIEVNSINSAEALAYLRKLKPEIIFVFGVGRIGKEVIEVCPDGIFNLHGGDPEEYRGLDSHLWAIYHNNFERLIVTLHRINEKLDDGDIVLQTPIPLAPRMELHELRRYNTVVCLQFVLAAMDQYVREGRVIARPQVRYGRYYSFMPSLLKEVCQRQFKRYVENLR